ncbi:phosphoribosyltransferase domain-containing protein [Paenibacillus hunanensis]|uniref:phosphoribosyltransferase family protein n=1 Tax=Paenibacillus hunanensis TaxID=539262 RepID=UPI002025FEF5|nr:phosphoribosyltransferase [Paenibacillus hunanensis]MCL9662971.1 phosphoribosyltransferase domain-containing protein [Paenibacillus hunanensis]
MIQLYKWDTFQQDTSLIIQHLNHIEWDLIVGVARGGLPLAVSLSHGLQCKKFGVVIAAKTNSEQAFDLNSTMNVIAEPALPSLDHIHNVLVVDDIVALGDGFSMVEKLLLQKYGNHISVRFTSLFADVEQIRQGPFKHLIPRLFSPNSIDNQSIWIEFPWERESGLYV